MEKRNEDMRIAEDLSRSALLSQTGAYRYTAVEMLGRIRDLEAQRKQHRAEQGERRL